MGKAIEKLREYGGEVTQPFYNETLKAILSDASLKLSNDDTAEIPLDSIANRLFQKGPMNYKNIFDDVYKKLADDNANTNFSP